MFDFNFIWTRYENIQVELKKPGAGQFSDLLSFHETSGQGKAVELEEMLSREDD